MTFKSRADVWFELVVQKLNVQYNKDYVSISIGTWIVKVF